MATPKQLTENIEKQMKKAILDALNESTILVWSTAKQLAPFGKTGLLGASIKFFVDEQKLQGTVFTDISYAPHVEYMTKPHIIKPKDKKALAWGKNLGTLPNGDTKREHLAKSVRHPGTRGQPFMRPAIDNNNAQIKKIFAKHINEIKLQ